MNIIHLSVQYIIWTRFQLVIRWHFWMHTPRIHYWLHHRLNNIDYLVIQGHNWSNSPQTRFSIYCDSEWNIWCSHLNFLLTRITLRSIFVSVSTSTALASWHFEEVAGLSMTVTATIVWRLSDLLFGFGLHPVSDYSLVPFCCESAVTSFRGVPLTAENTPRRIGNQRKCRNVHMKCLERKILANELLKNSKKLHNEENKWGRKRGSTS